MKNNKDKALNLGAMGYYGYLRSDNSNIFKINKLIAKYNSIINNFSTHSEQLNYNKKINKKIKKLLFK
jgi:hypothetical protein